MKREVLQIDQACLNSLPSRGVTLKVGQRIDLVGDFDPGIDPIRFKSRDGVRDVIIRPPYRYLGRGREKFVVSVATDSLDYLVRDTKRVAMGIACNNEGGVVPRLRYGLNAYSLLSESSIPTYHWYLESVDEKYCLMPDLTKEGTVVSSNTYSLSPEDKDKLVLRWDEILNHIKDIVEAALQRKPALKFTFDTPYVILDRKGGVRVILGDFDGLAVTESNTSWVRSDICDQVETFIDKICKHLQLRLTNPEWLFER